MDMALLLVDCEEGYGLMCMAKLTSDLLEIEWGTDDAQPKLFPPRENQLFVVTDRIDLWIDVASDAVAAAIGTHEAYIAEQVLGTSITLGAGAADRVRDALLELHRLEDDRVLAVLQFHVKAKVLLDDHLKHMG